MIEKTFAAIVLVACIALLLRMALKPAQRRRVDGVARRLGWRLRDAGQRLWHWPASRRRARAAAAAAEEAIRRARGDVERDGNVYRPKSFRKPPRKLH